jgi:hypothetical protein
MNSEARLLKRALGGEVKDLIEFGFDPEVLSPPYGSALQTLTDFFLRSGEVLPRSRLLKTCEGLEPGHIAKQAKKKATYYWTIIKSERIEDILQTTMEEVAQIYNDRDGAPAKVLEDITRRILDLNSKVAGIEVVVPSHAVIARMLRQEYKDAKAGKMPGIPFPPEFPLLEESIGRLRLGNMITIAARTEVGKTWLSLLIALHAAKCGFKVAIASMEMTPLEIVRRLAALFAKVNFDRAIKGTLQGRNEKLYMNVISGFERGLGFWENIRFIDPSEITSIEAVEIKAANFDANLIVGDAFYDWPYDPKLKDYEGIRSNLKTVRRLSLISRRHWLLTAQLNRRADKVFTSDEFAMGGTDAFNYLSNYVINLIQRKKDKKNKRMILRLGKKRDAAYSPPRVHNWDFKRMDISQVGIYNEDRSILAGGGDI